MRAFLSVLIFFCCTNICYSQILSALSFRSADYDKIIFLNQKAESFLNQGMLDSAIITFEQAFFFADKHNLQEEKCFILKEIGITYELSANYPKALEYLFQALSIAEQENLLSYQASVSINIGVVYFSLKKTNQAIQYYNLALNISESIKDTTLIIKSLNNLGNVYMTYLHDWQKSEKYFNQSVELAKLIGFEQAILVGLNNLCQIYMHTNREPEAVEVTNQMLEFYPENPYIYYNLANLYTQKFEYNQAINVYQKALELSGAEAELKMILLKDVSDIYLKLNNYELAYNYYRDFNILQDSIHGLDKMRQTEELEAKYQNLKKEKEIYKLNNKALKSDRTKNLVILISIIVGLTLLLIIVFINNKKKQASQKLYNLQQERLAMAAQATLNGEEKERKRLASELHDGLGGMLSAAKLILASENLSDNSISEISNLKNVINSSVIELRRISHKLMPETLLSLGIKTAIMTYINNFKISSGKTNFDFSFYGSENRFGKYFELTVYRICQELVNNAVKHAQAGSIVVQLVIDDDRLFLSVSDDGKGFEIVSSKNGLGLQSIKDRIEVFGGFFEINSTLNVGAEVVVEFNNIKQNSLIYD